MQLNDVMLPHGQMDIVGFNTIVAFIKLHFNYLTTFNYDPNTEGPAIHGYFHTKWLFF